MMEYCGMSDIGALRESNQDSYRIVDNRSKDKLLIVCDGIGGAQAGDVASKSAADFLSDRFAQSESFGDDEALRKWLLVTLKDTNRFVYKLAMGNPRFYGMGTTLVAALICGLGTYVINIGDSRAYTLAGSAIKCITKDHTLVESYVERGLISEQEAFNHPQRHVLTNAVGIQDMTEVDIFRIAEPYDYLLLCSDGLHGYSTDAEIAEIFATGGNACALASKLITYANNKGGFDNVTVVVASNDK